jgi:hypothetical protein
VGEIDIDAERIKNLALKLVRQSFACQQMVVFGAPARSLQVGARINSGSSGSFLELPASQIQGICSLQKMSTLFHYCIKARRDYLMGIAQRVALRKGLNKYISPSRCATSHIGSIISP